MQEKDAEVVVDLGGSIVSGIDGNPLALVAMQLDIPLHRIQQQTALHFSDGTVVPKELDKEVRLRFPELGVTSAVL